MQAVDVLAKGSHQHGADLFAAQRAEADPQSPPSTQSSDPDTLLDVQKQSNGQYSPPRPDGLRRAETGVSVKQAEADFAQLSREFSNVSQHSRKLSRTISRRSNIAKDNDVEKSAATPSESEEGEPFDLEQTLRGAKEQEAATGIKSKRIGVMWENLTVSGIGGVKNFVRVFPDAFVSFFNVPGTLMSIFGYGKKGKELDILKNFRGVVRPGEMVLVLGRPGSGCTTFLKVIANQRYGYTKVDGEVLYGPYDAKTFAKKYRGEAVYNQEGTHISGRFFSVGLC